MIEFLTFLINDTQYAIEITDIQEVVVNRGYSKLPKVEPFIRGLLNLRGKIVTVLDLEKLIFETEHKEEYKYTVVLNGIDETHNIGILSSKVNDLSTISESEIREVPSNLDNRAKKYIKNVFVLDNRTVQVLDIEMINNI